jgi:hypothetical protein
MKHINKFESFFSEKLPEVALEEFIPEERIYLEFEKFGYDAYDVTYIQFSDKNDNVELSITVSPKSFAYDGRFSKNFSQEMQEICDNIGADDFEFSATFMVKFHFDGEKYPDLVPTYSKY